MQPSSNSRKHFNKSLDWQTTHFGKTLTIRPRSGQAQTSRGKCPRSSDSGKSLTLYCFITRESAVFGAALQSTCKGRKPSRGDICSRMTGQLSHFHTKGDTNTHGSVGLCTTSAGVITIQIQVQFPPAFLCYMWTGSWFGRGESQLKVLRYWRSTCGLCARWRRPVDKTWPDS